MVIDGTDPFDAKPDARLIRLLLRARRFNATLARNEGVPFAALAQREGVSRSYFTRLVRLSYFPAQKASFRTRGLAGVAWNKKARRVMPAGR
jgi:regulator of sirC expression with transglutaminase-like and TPR domain